MKKSFKQIIAFSITGLIVFCGMGIINPPKVHAQLAVTDPGDTIENTFNDIEDGVTSFATTYLQLKSSVFDAIATAIAKQILMQITLSVVNWINSGFNGSPAFIQNPGQFFENVGDQIAGNFLAANSDLAASLCSPFSIDLRVSLALQIGGGLTSQYSCSLSTMIKNTTNAVKGATINGFTAGDFRQGGWPAFLALTTVPANNPNGAYLQAEANLSVKIGNQQAIKLTQLNQGNGLLSWTTCTPDPNADYEDDDDYSDDSGQDCEVQTPGSAISNALNKHLDVPTENLELANDMNAIINALFSQLVVQVLGGGLTSVSKPSATGQSYLQQISNSENSQLQTLQSNTLSQLSPYIANQNTITQNADTALSAVLAAQNTLENVNACYTAIVNATSSVPYPQAITYAQGQIAQVQVILASTTGPMVIQLTAADNIAHVNLQSYQNLSTNISSAQTVNQLGTSSQNIQGLAQTNSLPTPADVLTSNNSLSSTEAEIAPIQNSANSQLSACESFSVTSYGTGTVDADGVPVLNQ